MTNEYNLVSRIDAARNLVVIDVAGSFPSLNIDKICIHISDANAYLRRRKSKVSRSRFQNKGGAKELAITKLEKLSNALSLGDLPVATTIIEDCSLKPSSFSKSLNARLRRLFLPILYWHRSNLFMQRGDPRSALLNSSKAALYFSRLDNYHGLAQTEMIRCSALRMLGRLDASYQSSQLARRFAKKCMPLASNADEDVFLVALSSTLSPAINLGLFREVKVHIDLSLEIASRNQNNKRIIESLFRLAQVEILANRYSHARDTLESINKYRPDVESNYWLQGWWTRFWAEYFLDTGQDESIGADYIVDSWKLHRRWGLDFQLFELICLIQRNLSNSLLLQLERRGFRMNLEHYHNYIFGRYHHRCSPAYPTTLAGILACTFDKLGKIYK